MIDVKIEEEFHCIGCGTITPLMQAYQIVISTKDYKLPFKINYLCKSCFLELQNKQYAKDKKD